MQRYTAWKHKRELLVSDPSATEGLQVLFTLPYKPGMRADFRDIRFSDEYGAPLAYAFENITNFSSAQVWVKLPADATLIYLYYGNGAATSESDTSAVFELWDNFDDFSISGKWNLEHGAATLINSILTLGHKTLNSVVQSSTKFGINTLVEIRANHCGCIGSKAIFGFRDLGTEHAVAWHGSTSALATDHKFSHNGTNGTWTNDGVNRGGTTFYTYSIVRLASSALYYVNDVYRGMVTTTIPSADSMIPVQFYIAYNHLLKIDWVRVRKYSDVMPTISFGKKYTTKPKEYPWENAIRDDTKIGMSQTVNLKSRLKDANAQLKMKSSVMFRRPLFYNPQLKSPYPRWKYKGEINLGDQESPVRVRLPILPGMTLDGRDLRYTDLDDNELRFNIFATESDFLDCWVEIPAGTTRIKFYYGNGTAKTKSNPEIKGVPETETIIDIIPHIGGGSDVWQLPGWKYQQEIKLSETASEGEQILLSIPHRPGMTADGRDFRFFDLVGNKLSYYIESITTSEFSVWIKLPANHDKIWLFYGNGAAPSESSASNTFDFFDDFDVFNGNEWNVLGGAAAASDSNLILGSETSNSITRSNSAFGTGTILEFRMYHPSQNASIGGYWSSTNQRACWIGAIGTNYNDHTQTYDGTASTAIDDTIDRGGNTYYLYGITYAPGSIGFYIDGILRRTMTTTTPSGTIPIAFYSAVNNGNVVVDWVRVRKITTITGTLGRRKTRVGSVYYETTTSEQVDVIPQVVVTHRPQWKTPQIYYEYISLPSSYLGMAPGEPTFKERRELADYAFSSCEVTKSINDAYMHLSTEFHNLIAPPEDSTIKHNAYDSVGTPHLIFHGKVVTSSPTHGHYNQSVTMQAADNSRNLVVQKVPWNYQVVDMDKASLPSWVQTLLAPGETGVYPKTLIDTRKESKQFIFNPGTTRLDAIKELASYAGCMIHTKLITRAINGFNITRPEFYLVPPENIDMSANGFDLPAPITLTYPDPSLMDEPKIISESEEKYNKVTVHGILSETGEIVVSSAFSAAVHTGEQKAKEYRIEDNSISEKGSTAEREAVKWLLYFLAPRTKVSMWFVDRFDLELYQRIRFGSGFSNGLQSITRAAKVPIVYACDPRDAVNSTHSVNVSGVPMPSWLRISEMRYHSEHALETVEVTAITDFIYSSVDPVVPEPYSQYLSPGYMKPIIDDLIQTTQTIVDDSIEKQLTPESCTVLSINVERKTAVVQTASGKIVTVSLA